MTDLAVVEFDRFLGDELQERVGRTDDEGRVDDTIVDRLITEDRIDHGTVFSLIVVLQDFTDDGFKLVGKYTFPECSDNCVKVIPVFNTALGLPREQTISSTSI